MFNLAYIITPVISMIVGYVTNALAIHMLFRPYNEVRIGRFRIPFTPGLIPKSRGRLASAIGDVVSRELLNPEVVRKTLLSDEMGEKIGTVLEEVFDNWLQDDRPVEEALREGVGDHAFEKANAFAREKLTGVLAEKVKEADVGDIVARSVLKSLTVNTPAPIHKMLTPITTEERGIGALKPLRAFINRYIGDNAQPLMETLVNRQFDSLLTSSVSGAALASVDQKPRIKKALSEGFLKLVEMGTERALSELNIAQMIEQQVGDFDSREIERIVFSVISRELRAIVWLGALFGFVIGLLNLPFI